MAAFRPSAGELLRFLQPGVAYLQASFARWNSLRLPNNQGWPEGDSALQVSHAAPHYRCFQLLPHHLGRRHPLGHLRLV